MPPGQRPNFSSHQTYALLQKERDSLDILASRLREKLDDLSKDIVKGVYEQPLLAPDRAAEEGAGSIKALKVKQ
jgi:hypothetical protein